LIVFSVVLSIPLTLNDVNKIIPKSQIEDTPTTIIPSLETPSIQISYNKLTEYTSNLGGSLTGTSNDYNISCNIISIGGRSMPTKIKSTSDNIVCDVIIKNTCKKNIYNTTLVDAEKSSSYISGADKHAESITYNNILEPNEIWSYQIISHAPEDVFSYYDLNFEANGDAVNKIRISTDRLTNEYNSYNPWKNGNTYWVGGDGHKINLHNNEGAKDPTYNELINFIANDNTDRHAYIPNSFVCADFAETVHNNAEATGLKAGWVTLDFVGDSRGHVCNTFNTTDRGQVFIDCTSSYPQSSGSYDSIVNLRDGGDYTPQHIGSYDGSYYDSMGTVSDHQIYW
jgi:hypothetical protein